MFFRVIPLILASLIISAHFFRHLNYPLMIVSFLAPFMLFIKRRWSLITVQVFTILGGGVWLITIAEIAKVRILVVEPWGKMAVILGVVALFTIFAGQLLNSSKVKEKYPSKH